MNTKNSKHNFCKTKIQGLLFNDFLAGRIDSDNARVKSMIIDSPKLGLSSGHDRSPNQDLFHSLLFFSLLTSRPIHNFLRVFTFYRCIAVNPHVRLRLIQTLCLHLSCSTLGRKTLTFNHYFGINYFQNIT